MAKVLCHDCCKWIIEKFRWIVFWILYIAFNLLPCLWDSPIFRVKCSMFWLVIIMLASSCPTSNRMGCSLSPLDQRRTSLNAQKYQYHSGSPTQTVEFPLEFCTHQIVEYPVEFHRKFHRKFHRRQTVDLPVEWNREFNRHQAIEYLVEFYRKFHRRQLQTVEFHRKEVDSADSLCFYNRR